MGQTAINKREEVGNKFNFGKIEELKIQLEKSLGAELFKDIYHIVDVTTDLNEIKFDEEKVKNKIKKEWTSNKNINKMKFIVKFLKFFLLFLKKEYLHFSKRKFFSKNKGIKILYTCNIISNEILKRNLELKVNKAEIPLNTIYYNIKINKSEIEEYVKKLELEKKEGKFILDCRNIEK